GIAPHAAERRDPEPARAPSSASEPTSAGGMPSATLNLLRLCVVAQSLGILRCADVQIAANRGTTRNPGATCNRTRGGGPDPPLPVPHARVSRKNRATKI